MSDRNCTMFVARRRPSRNARKTVRAILGGAAIAVFGLTSLATAGTKVGLSLVRADAPARMVDTAQRGSIVAYSRYRGPVVTWAFGLNVDGKHSFDERDAQGRIVNRIASLELDLAEGEHVIEPLGVKFRVAAGRIESLSPELTADGNRLALRLHPVTFHTSPTDGPAAVVRVRIASEKGELFQSPPGVFPGPLTLYLPATTDGGYLTNLSDELLHVSERGVHWEAPDGRAASGPSAADGSSVLLPTWRVTGVLLLDRPAKTLAVQLSAREEATQGVDFETKIGNWDPRPRITAHGELAVSRAGWRFSSGVHEWSLTAGEQREFRHHAFLIDRPTFHEPDGNEKERVLHVAIHSDVVAPGDRIAVRWNWIGTKGLAPLVVEKLAAFVQQSPALADDAAGWQPLEIVAGRQPGEATFVVPPTLSSGRAWLRIGLADRQAAAPTDRLLAEAPLLVRGEPADRGGAQRPAAAAAQRTIEIGGPARPPRAPAADRQGEFLHPQCVSAIDISGDGKSIGVATMAFRHDRNFWLLSEEGRVLWGRYVEPWAPFQAAVLPEAKTCGVGLAYSRFTDPSPTVSVFQGETGEETPLVDSIWDMGWLRYGEGDWRTGWPASLVGDLFAKAGNSIFTIFSHGGAWQFAGDGSRQTYPLLYQRPFRMAASADGHVLACGYLAPDVSTLDDKTRGRLRSPPALVAARNTLTSADLWAVAPGFDGPLAPQPPEAADDFPELAAEFNIKPLAIVPFRAALSLSLDGDGSTVAAAEYGGWLRIKRERGIGSWNPDHPAAYCPRQRGRLRVFGARGEELAQAEFPVQGLFEVHLDRQGETVWCAPASWFARGLAGRSWLPADPDADTVFSYDLRAKTWRAAWRFPDAVSDLAVHPDGRRMLVSCWDGKIYSVDRDGQAETIAHVGEASRVQWSADGRFAVAGSQSGEVSCFDARGPLRWKVSLPVAEPPPSAEPLQPVFADVPIYSVGRVGAEHAYVGDIWMIKTEQGAILVDCGGASAIPLTWQRMKAAGVDPGQVRYALLSHSHGDHAGASYLWRTQGAKIVAPETAALTANWLMPTWSDYSIWVPSRIDVPLALKRAGDEAETTLCGLKITAVFVPGHSFDSALYLMEFGGKRVAFTGDIGFEGESNILHRCWGDREKARIVTEIVRRRLLAFRPDYVFTGHGPRRPGAEFVEDLVKRSEAALADK